MLFSKLMELWKTFVENLVERVFSELILDKFFQTK
jgi:hypothetical protein